MESRDAALIALMAASAAGFLLADGEMRRVGCVRAMRRCLVRMHDLVRYEQIALAALLRRIDLHATLPERELTRLLHTCADKLDRGEKPHLALIFAAESACSPGFGALSKEDRAAFEGVLAELGRRGLTEQLRLIDEADERLRVREEILRTEGARRARLMRSLGVTGGAAMFLILL